MVFTVGYPHNQDIADSFAGLVSEYPQIAEVYFAVPGRPSSRYALDVDHGAFVRNLADICATGKKLNRLLPSIVVEAALKNKSRKNPAFDKHMPLTVTAYRSHRQTY